jgi:hypothetical protein
MMMLQINKFLKRIISGITMLSMSTANFAICFASKADVPDTATIVKLEPQSGKYQPLVRPSRQSSPLPATINEVLQRILNQSIIIPAGRSWSTLKFKDKKGQKVDPIVQAGPGSTISEYLFPCRVNSGSSLIGWGLISTKARGCYFIQVGTGQGNKQVQLPSTISQKSIKNNPEKKLDNTPETDWFQYCNAIENSGRGWGVSFSFEGVADPCQRARQECLAASSGNECSTVMIGEEPLDKSKISALMQCQIKGIPVSEFTDPKKPLKDELLWLKEKTQFLEETSCRLYVYQPGDLIISPMNNEQLTLVQTKQSANGNVVINALVGNVNILLPEERKSLTLNKGDSYSTETGKGKKVNCPKVFDSSSVQTFLNPDNWLEPGDPTDSETLKKQLAGYRQDFCTTKPDSDRFNPWFLLPLIPFILSPQPQPTPSPLPTPTPSPLG